MGDGDGSFGSWVSYAGGGWIAVGDLNGDTIPDLVTGSDSLVVRLGEGDGGFGSATSYSGGGAVALGDIDQDGALDVVVSNESSATVSFAGVLGTGRWKRRPPAPRGGGRIAPLADFNGDGVLDVAVGYYNSSASLTALVGQCDGSLGAQSDYNIGSQPRSSGSW